MRIECPYCNSTKTIPIVYGMPSYKIFEKEKQGKLKIGGCMVELDQPTRYCNHCKRDFGGGLKDISFEEH